MAIKHIVPAGLPTGTATGKVAGDNWRDDHNHVPFEVAMILGTTAALTPAAASATANTELYATAKPTRNLIDLSTASQARLVCMVISNGNATGATYKLSYMTTNNATWTHVQAGASAEITVPVGTGTAGTLRDSGWVNLAAGMKIDSCYIAALVGTAMGTTPPTIGSLTVFFR